MRVALDTNRYVDLCRGVAEHDLRLHDRDRHFDRLPQIVRV